MRTPKSMLAMSFLIMISAGVARPRECIVCDAADPGEGTLRQCLLDAVKGDTITFDPAVFPPPNPGIIAVLSALPGLVSGNIVVGENNAGVVLDGSGAPGGTAGFVVASDSNSISSLQVLNFPGGGSPHRFRYGVRSENAQPAGGQVRKCTAPRRRRSYSSTTTFCECSAPAAESLTT